MVLIVDSTMSNNIVTDKIQMCVGDSTIFDLELRGNLIVIDGCSGVGKTYFFNSLRNAKYSGFPTNVNGVDLEKVLFINAYIKDLINIIEILKWHQGKLFVIDDADIIFTKEIAEYIGWDNKNQYIVFSRASWPFGLPPNYFAQMVDKNNKRILEYGF